MPSASSIRSNQTWLTASEAAARLGVSAATLRRHAEAGTVPSFRLGDNGQRRYREQDIAALTGEGEQ